MYLTTLQFAARAGLSPSWIRLLCRRGSLDCLRAGRDWIIPETELCSARFLERPRRGERRMSVDPFVGR